MPKKKTTTKSRDKKEEVEVLIEDDALSAMEVISIEDLTEDEIREVVPTLVEVPTEKRTPRAINFCGDLNEESASAIISAMIYHNHNNNLVLVNQEQTKQYMAVKPMQFYISTFGGNAADMFGIHDLMLSMRASTPIETVGLGKVMSAGVLLLASGAEDSRFIGKNTRVMIHSLRAGHAGAMHELETEYEETKWLQDQYIEALSSVTNMNKRMIKKMMERKTNVYINAKQAIEYGIADRILDQSYWDVPE
jgi:ATP-dependent Clp endopeptidase proteolytic subunit ClpP|tara:strand:- start:103 stop:852 length:750 start_codon:yes stop_codon:yes gene_type:complete